MEDDIWNLCRPRSGVPLVDNPEYKARKILEKKRMLKAGVSLQCWNGDKLTKLTMLTKFNRKRVGRRCEKGFEKDDKDKTAPNIWIFTFNNNFLIQFVFLS